eukprot:TRINITY_DN820_c0_g1_i2.p1 TRINITY_DN820_c0_g1~~TRINITY_DN820_c0_g1_i2.p1  ORF type:complete len:279 (+),score=60.90 TRINITY_DN820_c0_g1_i2:92-928(+)
MEKKTTEIFASFPSKKRAREQNEEDEDSSQEEMELDNEEIPVDFVFKDPSPTIDFKTVKTFVTRLLDGKAWNSSDFADIIVKQQNVGSLIKVDGDDEGFGFITTINLQVHKGLPSIQELVFHIKSQVSKYAPKEQIDSWNKLIDSPTTGLIINERMFNVPPQLAPHLLKCLFEEIQWAIEDKEPFNFDHYLILTNYYLDAVKKPQKIKKTDEDMQFYKIEDEVFLKNAKLSLSYKILLNDQESRWTFDKMSRQYRVFIIVEASKMPSILGQVEEMLKD